MDGTILICPEAMAEDLQELYQNILKTHPNPYIYCSKEELDSAYSAAQNAVLSSKSVLDFSIVLTGFIKNIRDSHTYFNPRDILVLLGNKSKSIPFYLNKIDSRFYMSKSYNNCIPVGAEIIEVGKMTVDSLYNLTRQYSPKEAYTESARGEITTKMMGLVFNVQNKSFENDVQFKYVNRLGDTLLTLVGRIKSKKLFKNEDWYPSKELEYEFLNNKAYLRVYSFESRNEKKFKKTIDRFFSIVASNKIDSVIIDVRENRGGYILLLEHLLSYINVNEQTYDLNYSYKRSDLDRFESLSRLKKIDFVKKAKRVYPRGMISKEYNFYLSPKGTVRTILYEKKLANSSNYIYRGNCSLYINGLSMSASVLLASWFKETNRGEIIGTPCFGSLNATHGNPATIFLKNSGLPLSISTLKLTPNNVMESKWGDIHIDKKITLSLKDIEQGADPFIFNSLKD
ncbi:S41 family peptidase [Crocinitomicaceae bacterium]|nr:S41 family peptidase [Crocinitomicaceae bacterium]